MVKINKLYHHKSSAVMHYLGINVHQTYSLSGHCAVNLKATHHIVKSSHGHLVTVNSSQVIKVHSQIVTVLVILRCHLISFGNLLHARLSHV